MGTCKHGKLIKPIWFGAVILLPAMLLFSCSPVTPTPADEQILQAVVASNEAEIKPLEFIYEELQVPHRLPGRAHAVLWVADKSVQRNFIVMYDENTKNFLVESHITLILGEDGVYREEPQ